MDLPSIPDDDERPTKLPAKLHGERNGRRRAEIVFVDLERQADLAARGRERHGADDAQPVVAVPRSLHGRATAAGPSAAVDRLQAEA